MKRIGMVLMCLAAALSGCGVRETGGGAGNGSNETVISIEAGAVNQAAANDQSEALKVVVLGEYDPQISGQQIIAKELGFFAEEGLEVDLQLLTDPSVSTSMVAANEAQFYSISNYQAINLVDKGSEVCLLAPVVDAGNTQVIVGGAGLDLSSARDLEGKRMGYTDGAGVIVAVKNMCDDLGVDFNAIQLVNLQASDMLVSLESGDIDFFAAWEPWGIKAQEFGGEYLFTGTKSYLPENTGDVSYLNFVVCIDVSKTFMEQNPAACQAYLRAMIKATDYINENLEAAAKMIGEQIHIDHETCIEIMAKNEYQVAFNQTFKDSCDALSAYMEESGLNTSRVDFSAFAYPELLSGIDGERVDYK